MVDETKIDELHRVFTRAQLKQTGALEDQSFFLEIWSNEKILVKLHGDEKLLSLIQCILKSVQNVSVSSLLKALQLPKAFDLNQIIQNGSNIKMELTKLQSQIDSFIETCFKSNLK
jgi:hypothetical protein